MLYICDEHKSVFANGKPQACLYIPYAMMCLFTYPRDSAISEINTLNTC